MGDADGDVDWADFAAFVDYLLGPFADQQLAGWRLFYVDTRSTLRYRAASS